MTQNLSGNYELPIQTLGDVIYQAYDELQVATDGEPISGGLFNRARDALNLMIKNWQSQGIRLWTITEGSLFLQVGLDKFDFRDEGRDLGFDPTKRKIHLANEFIQRATTTAIAATNLGVDLDDVTFLEVGDQIGFVGDNRDLEWFIVMQISGNTVQFDRAAANPAMIGSVCYTYRYLFSTTLTGAALAAAVTLTVADTTLFAAGNEVLIHLDDNTTDTREIASVDEGASTITITNGISSPAAIGKAVVNTSTRRDQFAPVERILNDTVRRRESTDYEIPIVFQSRKDYFDLPNKNQPGTPIQAYYDRQQPQGVMYLWNPPFSALPIINFTYERAVQVATDPDHTLDMPEDWILAVVWNLAEQLIPRVGCSESRAARITTNAEKYLDQALAFDQAVYPIRLKPQKYG